ncbi:MAG: hypothetical protein PHE61_08000, partial [Candidatus Omnitrophica bacterium]|nr:hypothetical protein [Candidatus Omnitrophota bacterium]
MIKVADIMKNKEVTALVILGVFLFLVLSPYILCTGVFMVGDLLNWYFPYCTHYSTQPNNPMWIDTQANMFPQVKVFYDLCKTNGRITYWNPYAGGG